jgi:hypothetical protein
MKMLLLSVLVVLFLFPSKPTLRGTWIASDAKWQQVPADVSPGEEFAETTVLVFGTSGKIALIECVVLRKAQEFTNISHGDPQNIFLGTWDLNLPGQVRYRLVSRTVPIKGQTLPGSWTEKPIALAGQDVLLDGQRYSKFPVLEVNAREVLRGTADKNWR